MIENQKKYKLISCEILFRELCYCAARSKNLIDIEFLPKGLHDIGSERMSARLQEIIDKVEPDKYDAIILGYALCNNGIVGLKSNTKLVIPRAHDCITLLLGSKERYMDYHSKNSGAYYKSTGWIERDTNLSGLGESIPQQLGISSTYQEYVEKYGEENAQYIMEMTGDWLKNYTKFTFIDTPVGDFDNYKEITKKDAEEKNLEYEEIEGDLGLLQRLVDGQWSDEEFLVLEPNRIIKATYKDDIITAQ
jgi:hypothetical protein